jgi:rRNA maturation endonuclease Nob1
MAEHGRIPVPLRLCRGCKRFVKWDERPECVFCGVDLDTAEAEHEANLAEMRRAADALREALARHRN